MELMLYLLETVLLLSDDVDTPLYINCGGREFIESKNFL